MGQQHEAASDENTRRLVDKLESVRRDCADAPEEQRRQAFRQTLERELEGLPSDAVDAVLTAVRERLIHDARERERKFEELQTEVSQLRASLDSLTQENEALKAQGGAKQAAPSPGGNLEKIRDGLRALTKNKEVTPESLGLPPSEARLFRLIQQLVRFALGYEMGVNLLLAEFRIGPTAEMDTRMMQGMRQEVRDRFRACLEDQKGSLAKLKEILDRNSRFVVDLNRAYTACIYEGSRSLLSEIDPQPILEQHKRMMGHDYEKAWGSLSRSQADLAALSSNELWERFYFKVFRERLSDYLGKDGG